MYQELAKLLLYSDLGPDSILSALSDVFFDWDHHQSEGPALIGRIYGQMKRLLDLATDFGFDENLWQNYLTFLLLTNENSFTLTAERAPVQDGSVNHFALGDFAVFLRLFHYDFGPIEKDLGIDCFSTICHYRAIEKQERRYNKTVSQTVQALSRRIAQASTPEEVFQILTGHYQAYGVGLLGLNRAFRIGSGPQGLELRAINNLERSTLESLIGYDWQKKALVRNTEAFLKGLPANNVLLYGDSGTGKSTSVKLLVNQYYDQGLRMIELYKHQFEDLSAVIAKIKNRNYKFILFLDDLSFEEHEVEYKFLKAVIEGGVETRPDNVLIYATSNRRHLIKETWADRSDMEHDGDIHRSDTLEEKLSLASRFGLTIHYASPTRGEFLSIVSGLAQRQGLQVDPDRLVFAANQWEIRHGGLSGRTAQQFINDLAGQMGLPEEESSC